MPVGWITMWLCYGPMGWIMAQRKSVIAQPKQEEALFSQVPITRQLWKLYTTKEKEACWWKRKWSWRRDTNQGKTRGNGWAFTWWRAQVLCQGLFPWWYVSHLTTGTWDGWKLEFLIIDQLVTKHAYLVIEFYVFIEIAVFGVIGCNGVFLKLFLGLESSQALSSWIELKSCLFLHWKRK